MRTLNKELKNERKESKIKKFAFNSMKKAKEGLMIVTMSAVLCAGFTNNNLYGDEKMDEKGGQVRIEQPEKTEQGRIPVKLEGKQWTKGIEAFQEVKSNLSLNAIFKTDIDIGNFKSFIGDKKPSEIISENRARYIELGLNEREVDRMIEIAQKYDTEFNKVDKINMSTQDGTSMALLMYFTLLSGEHGELGKDVINTGDIRLSSTFVQRNEDISDLYNFSSVMSTHSIERKKNFPTTMKQTEDAEQGERTKIETEGTGIEGRGEIEEEPRIIDLEQDFTRDPGEIVSEQGLGPKINVNELTEREMEDLIYAARKRLSERNKSVEEAEKRGQKPNQEDLDEIDGLERFIKELEEKWNESQKIKESKIIGGKFGVGLGVDFNLRIYNTANSELSFLGGVEGKGVWDWDNLYGVKYNTVWIGGNIGLAGVLNEVAKGTNLYAVSTVSAGGDLDKNFTLSLNQTLGITTQRGGNYSIRASQQVVGEREYTVGTSLTSPIGLGVNVDYRIINQEFNPGVHYKSEFFDLSVSTRAPLNSNYLFNASSELRLKIPISDWATGEISFFFTIGNLKAVEGKREEYSPVRFDTPRFRE